MKLRNEFLIVLFISLIFLSSCIQAPEVTSAKVYIQQDNIKLAKEQLEIAKRKYPDNAEVYYLLSTQIYGPQGQLDKAYKAIEKAVELDPNYKSKANNIKERIWAKYHNRGVTKFNSAIDETIPSMKKSLLQEAADNFKKALKIKDTSKKTYTGLIMCYQALDETDKVIKYSNEATEKGIYVNKALDTDSFAKYSFKELSDKLLEDNEISQTEAYNLLHWIASNDKFIENNMEFYDKLTGYLRDDNLDNTESTKIKKELVEFNN